MKEIKLTQGQIAIVDDWDFEALNKLKWYANKIGGRFYADRGDCGGGKRKHIRMHRVVLSAPAGLEVDHINGNSLDNRRANLRLATKRQNQHNQKHPKKNNKLGVKGVCLHAGAKKYRARIRYNSKLIHLGLFASLEDADKAYRAAENKYFGEFAR